MKSFGNWTRQQIANQFNLSIKQDCTHLDDWINASITIDKIEEQVLLRLQKKLRQYADIWNEQELIIHFIAILVDLVDFNEANYKAFANRKLVATIDDQEVLGEVDFMVASGLFEPTAPYFCLHEYKREKNADKDPLGQLIIAMMAAQALNKNQEVIYGAYVRGRNWFFLTLQDRAYCISEVYVATREDIFQIFIILKKLKLIIHDLHNS